MSSFLSDKRAARFGPFVLVAGVYYLTARFSLLLALETTNASPLWPPTGIALAAVLMLGYRIWPAIALGAFFANFGLLSALGFTTLLALAGAFGTATGNTLEALVGGFLVLRFTGGRNPFASTGDIVKFVLFGALVGTTLSAVTGAGIICSIQGTWNNFGMIWLTWWVGDAVGALVLTPLIMTWENRRKSGWTPLEIAEVAVILLIQFVLGWIVFGRSLPVPYLFTPLLLWTVFRFGQFESSAFILILSSISVAGALKGAFVFHGPTHNASLLLIQGFIGISSITSMLLSSLINERNAAFTDLGGSNAVLLQEIDERQRAEDLLRLREQEFRSLAENSPDNIARYDLQCRLMYFNPSLARTVNLDYTERLGKTPVEASPGGWKEMIEYEGRIRKVLETGQPGEIEFDISHPSGELHTHHVRFVAERDVAGNIVGVLSIGRDISERKKMEEELRTLNEELEKRVKERTAELEEKNAELQKMNKLFVGRELRMVELKEKIRDLEKRPA